MKQRTLKLLVFSLIILALFSCNKEKEGVFIENNLTELSNVASISKPENVLIISIKISKGVELVFKGKETDNLDLGLKF